MRRRSWPRDWNQLGEVVNRWTDVEAAALLGWAIWAADGLAYLLELDERTFGSRDLGLSGHNHQSVDLAHVRWASISAITVIDLCAATLGRLRCPPRGNEYSMPMFDSRAARGENRPLVEERLALLTDRERGWAEDVSADEQYRTVRRARNPMTHARLVQTHYGGNVPPKPHSYRAGFPVGPGREIVDSRPLIELCAAVANRHLDRLLEIVRAEGESSDNA
jgi:hypothetical protein